MSARRALFFAVLALGLAKPPAVHADKLDKDSKKWLDEVAPIILSEEEKTFRSLKDKADRDEFVKIFWARRNPLGPAATENPFKVEFDKLRAEADKRFSAAGRTGSATDCARFVVLLGEPSEVKKGERGDVPGRLPEIWTYKDRLGYTFTGGKLELSFDGQCQLGSGSGGVLEQLNRPAEAKVVSPNMVYNVADGRLTKKLVDLLPKPTPVQALLKEPRQDFPLSAQPKLMMRGKEGAVYVGGLVRAEADGLTVQEEAGKKKAAIVVAAQALDEAGKVVASTPDLESTAEIADGSVVGSYGLTLRPGKYTLRVGALDPKGSKGSVVSEPLEVPDLGSGELTMTDLIILADFIERKTQDPKDPLAAFFMGTAQLVPRFGNVFSKSEAIHSVLSFVYNPKVDPATGKASVGARFTILKDGKPASHSEEQVFDTPMSTPSIGPVPLASFEPGRYSIQLKVTDKVEKRDYTKETAFEVKP